MSTIHRTLRRTSLPILLVLCLAALSVSYAFADEAQRPLATQVIGDPDAAVTGKLAVGTATPGNKALTVVGVIDFLGAGTVHNYFTQGGGNNLQINTNVDEANTVGDATKSQWKLVMGSSLDWFSIRRSPVGGTYNEDALFFIQGSTGRVGIATVDTANGGAIPFTPQAKLHVETASGDAVRGVTSGTSGMAAGVYGQINSTSDDAAAVSGLSTATVGNTVGVRGETNSIVDGVGVMGIASATTGGSDGVGGLSYATNGTGVVGYAGSTTGVTYGVKGYTNSPDGYAGWFLGRVWVEGTVDGRYGVNGQTDSTDGTGVRGRALATSGVNYGVYGESSSPSGHGVHGWATAKTGYSYGVYGLSNSSDGTGVLGVASNASGATMGVMGTTDSTIGTGVAGVAYASSGYAYGIIGQSNAPLGRGVYGMAASTTGVNYGVYGTTDSPSGYGVYFIGGLAGTGAKSAIVETDDFGWRHLYAVESPQNWFEDFGQATLVAGEVDVPIEEVFAQTVNLAEDYHVFLTPLGDGCTLFVAEKSSSAFTVRAQDGATCEIAFDYRIIAPRLDYEDLRLKEAEDPEAVAAAMPEAPPAPAAQ